MMDSLAPGAVITQGCFAVVNTGTKATRWIELGEFLSGGGHSQWDHAVICSRVEYDSSHHPVVWIVEAQPGGAVEVPWHYQDRPHLWSAGRVPNTAAAGLRARDYIGTPYSAADYFAIAAHALHLRVPGLKDYVADSRHMICSQLVDQAELDGGVHLFRDGRWPGYVRPADLGRLIAQHA